MVGILLALSAAVGWGVSAVLARAGLQRVRSTSGTLASLTASSLLTLALAFLFNARDIVALSGTAFLWFLLAGVINFPLGRLLNYTGVRLAGVTRANPIIGAAPLFATFLAITLGNETVTVPILLGTFLVVGGLALIVSQR